MGADLHVDLQAADLHVDPADLHVDPADLHVDPADLHVDRQPADLHVDCLKIRPQNEAKLVSMVKVSVHVQ